MYIENKIGRYQNDVRELPNLTTQRYERIFKVFGGKKDNKNYNFYNILHKIDIPENIDANYLGLYVAKSNEPFTLVSHNIYNDIYSWWLVVLLNKKSIGKRWYVPAGTQLKYILPEHIGRVIDDITMATVFDNRHY